MAEVQTAEPITESADQFIERITALLKEDPGNRDRLLAEMLWYLRDIHTTMVGAFSAIQSGGIGSILGALRQKKE